jgi:hypothetical protein
MKKGMLIAVAALTLISGSAIAKKVRDWHDLHAAHMHLQQVIHELERARGRNNYDMQGHGAKAEEFAHKAEAELNMAVEAIKAE